MAIKIARVQTDDRLVNQLQQNIAAVIEPIFRGLSGIFTTTLSGCTTTPTGTAYWQRATAEGPVILLLPALTGTSNVATAYLTGLPAALWPLVPQSVLARIYDNGALAVAPVLISPDGTMQLYKSVSTTVFTTSGAKGTALSTVIYMTAGG